MRITPGQIKAFRGPATGPFPDATPHAGNLEAWACEGPESLSEHVKIQIEITQTVKRALGNI
jgi:hypothetical protein